jgi:uncharacterized membrane protein YraQ (UPF0718 family)
VIAHVLSITTRNFLGFLPTLIIAIVVAQILNSYISREVIERLRTRSLRENLFVVTLIGLVTPGPLACYLPLLKVLRKTGLPLSLIVTFITAQTLVGPLRLFLEVGYLGLGFFAYRVAASFAIAASVGFIYHHLERRITF